MGIASRERRRRAQQGQLAGYNVGATAAPSVSRISQMMKAGAAPAWLAVLLLLLPVAARPESSALAAGESPVVGVPGPSAAGAASGLHQTAEPSGRGPAQAREIPRRYPVDQATFDRLKAEANARADADAPGDETPGEGVP